MNEAERNAKKIEKKLKGQPGDGPDEDVIIHLSWDHDEKSYQVGDKFYTKAEFFRRWPDFTIEPNPEIKVSWDADDEQA